MSIRQRRLRHIPMPHIAEIPSRKVHEPPPVHVVADGDAGADGAVAEEDPTERGAAGSDPVHVVAGGQTPGGVEREPRHVRSNPGRTVHHHRVVVRHAGVVADDVDRDAVGQGHGSGTPFDRVPGHHAANPAVCHVDAPLGAGLDAVPPVSG